MRKQNKRNVKKNRKNISKRAKSNFRTPKVTAEKLVKLTNLFMTLRGRSDFNGSEKLMELYKTEIAAGRGDNIAKVMLELLEEEGVNLI